MTQASIGSASIALLELTDEQAGHEQPAFRMADAQQRLDPTGEREARSTIGW